MHKLEVQSNIFVSEISPIPFQDFSHNCLGSVDISLLVLCKVLNFIILPKNQKDISI